MKILYIHYINSDYYNDYMSDLLLHGLREIIGENLIDYPGCWYMYSDELKKRNYDQSKLWGKGFTTQNLLENYNTIDRENILNKIKNRYFDLVIYASIRRSCIFLDEVIKFNNKFIFIDGEDDNFIDSKFSNKSLYFKRELFNQTSAVLPINFAIPEKKIAKKIDTEPKNILAPLIPGRLKTYTYKKEKEYYQMYKKSIFALTYKKSGWDCLRHYEIMMNGCIPLFLQLEDCPEKTMTKLPKKKLLLLRNKFENILSYFNPLSIYKKKFLSYKKILHYLSTISFEKKNIESFIYKNPEIFDLKYDLLDYTKKNLTTKNLGKYIIDCTNIKT